MKETKEKLAEIKESLNPESLEQAIKEAERRHNAADAVALEYTGTNYCDRCVPEAFRNTVSKTGAQAREDW